MQHFEVDRQENCPTIGRSRPFLLQIVRPRVNLLPAHIMALRHLCNCRSINAYRTNNRNPVVIVPTPTPKISPRIAPSKLNTSLTTSLCRCLRSSRGNQAGGINRAVTLNLRIKPNETWSMDFMADQLSDGHSIGTLYVLDDFNREGFCIEVYFCAARRASRAQHEPNH